MTAGDIATANSSGASFYQLMWDEVSSEIVRVVP